MKQLIIILSLIFAICHKSAKGQDDDGLYSRRYERLDIGTILTSPRLVTNYVDCLLNKKPCPPEGKALKRILPEALRTKCGKCWPNQKEGALKVITSLYNDYPKHYNALREKWDPTGEYHRRFQEYLRDQSFNTIGSNNNNYQDNDEINQGQQTQVTTTVIANSNRKPFVQATLSNSNSIDSDQISSQNANRISSIQQNHSSNLHKIPSVQSSRNSKNTPSAKPHSQNSERFTPPKSSHQNSNKIPVNQNHNSNSNSISPNKTPPHHSNRLQSIETIEASSNRQISVQNIHPISNRKQPSQTLNHNSNRLPSVQTSPSKSNRVSQIESSSHNSNRIASVQNPRRNSNNSPPIYTSPTNSNRLLSLQSPLFNFNIIPSIQTTSANLNRFSVTTPQTPKSNMLPLNRFNLNIIPSIQTSLNWNRIPLLLSPSSNSNRIPFNQSPFNFTPLPIPSSINQPKSIQNNNFNRIGGSDPIQTPNHQISFRFSNDERSSQNDISILQRSTPNIPKPTKISTNKIRSSSTTRLPKTRSSVGSVSTTKNPNSRRNTTPTRRNNVITQRPTRQGPKTTTTIQPIIIPSTAIQSTTIRQSTISTTTAKRPTTRLTTTRSPITTTTTTEFPELNSTDDLFNRFGGSEDENMTSSTTTTTTTRRPARPISNLPQPNRPQSPVSTNQPQYVPGFVTTTTFHTTNNILNIINRLTTKLSNTADFVAGVLRVPQAIIEKTRKRHRVIWQNYEKNILPSPKRTALTFRLF